ncbi:MAG: sodium:solute symporter [Candidatus Thermoplasmatota archaeon]|jgi:SSS family solute:Na+ symporter|nr:sodium:solute symporter [Candidatus Thermoplasmatota archaeon]
MGSFALEDYVIFFVIVIGVLVAGFLAYFWRKPKTMEDISEWGIGGHRFGTVVVWFLLGGDLYTAYTLVAVPGLASSSGALGMFAITYGIMIYPIVYATMPRMWNVSKRRGYITAADYVKDRFSSRSLAMLIALTGVVAEIPYIALQIVGIKFVMESLAIPATIGLSIAFLLVAGFTFFSGLRAPALTAIIKDAIIWAAVIVIVIYVPIKLGGFAHMFQSAAAINPITVKLSPSLELGYVTLALGSALALFLYPHAITGTLGAKNTKTIRRNSALLPLYNVLLLFVAIIGIAAVVQRGSLYPSSLSSLAFPDVVLKMFPSAFTAFAFAAVVVGSIVPASIMALGSANLLTRNVYYEYINQKASSKTQSWLSRFLVIAIIVLALLFSFIPVASKDIIFLQTFGGAFILQTLPAVYLSLYTRKLNKWAVGAGWLVGLGSALYFLFEIAFASSLYKPLDFIYIGILSLVLNLATVGIGMLIFYLTGKVKNEGIIWDSEFQDFEK